ncbi:hypothetical protein phiHau3_25 [Streptomyces phage phiHau3]|uniref:Uncharacterized protein n=1 Tax=Streptomyces phage phiHau3 TaxID=1204524 RepID=K4HZL9_9CAUD|nr:hypothetical protein phiHau3_25 [Streptomyces phage phiHau3]AFU62002.1 hypothetical protein phiHau3_25 [Streptomyces phage phiHau3]
MADLVTGGRLEAGSSSDKLRLKLTVNFPAELGTDPYGGLNNTQRSAIVKAALDAAVALMPSDGYHVLVVGSEEVESSTEVSARPAA